MDYLTFLSKLIWPGVLIYVLIKYGGQIGEFFKTIAEDWEEIRIKGMAIKRNKAGKAEAPEPTGATPSVDSVEELSPEANRVLSTLWKHQQEYYSDHTQGRWTFAVGITSPRYADFLVGVGQSIRKGLVTISPQNGQFLLSDAGITFCKQNKDKLLKDWNFDRWKSFD